MLRRSIVLLGALVAACSAGGADPASTGASAGGSSGRGGSSPAKGGGAGRSDGGTSAAGAATAEGRGGGISAGASGGIAAAGAGGVVASGGASGGSGGSSGMASGVGGSVDDAPRLATDVAIGDVAVFQTVKVSIVTGGSAVATRNAPVIAGKKGWVRAYVQPSATFTPRMLRGELVIDAKGVTTIVADERTISGPSSDAAPDSSFTFPVEAEQTTADATYSVRVVDPAASPVSGATPSDARFPRDGSLAALGATPPGGTLHVVLVPMRYLADGSGRLPDTTQPQLDTIRALLLALYPITDVLLDVHAPVDWSTPLKWNGNVDFSALNSTLVDLRASDAAKPDAYYYGMIAPADDFATYCGGSCVTGQSFVDDDPTYPDDRVGSGMGFSGEDSAWTLAHEVGHMHGRYHAPCDAPSPDASYPYSGGGVGVWGVDPRTMTFADPSVATDVMGYCDVEWISDYTYAALHERAVAIASMSPAPPHPQHASPIAIETWPRGAR